MEDCVFCKIIKGKVPAKFVHQGVKVVAFHDIRPIKPVHILIVPKKHVGDFTDLKAGDIKDIKDEIEVLVNDLELKSKGYRVEVNGGTAMGVPHVHFHLLSPMGVAEPA